MMNIPLDAGPVGQLPVGRLELGRDALASFQFAFGGAGTPDATASPLPQMLLVIGVVALGVILTMSIRGKIARRNAAAGTPRERLDEIRSRAAAVDNVHALEAGLIDTARRLAAQLDAKAERVELLIEHADERIAELRHALDRAVGDGVSSPPAVPAPPADEPSPIAGETLPVEPASPDVLASSVYELADQGHGPIEIARQLEEQVGKVELILALRVS